MPILRVYFATNRNHQPDRVDEPFGCGASEHGAAALRFGHAEFREVGGDIQRTAVEVYPERLVPGSDAVKGSDRFLASLHQAMCDGARDTLIFIHGFNVSFNEALSSAALLARDIRIDRRPVNVVVFSWPSDGLLVPFMSYYSDREDGRASGPALARAFLRLKEFLTTELEVEARCEQRLHILAHSMGAYVLRHGLQAIRAKDPRALVRVFDQILLVAADEDDDAFETDEKLKPLSQIGRQVTVYFNPNDRALVISDKTKGNRDRLGSDGPRLVDLIPKKVELVDCQVCAPTADPKGRHSYHVNSPAVAADISAVLRGQLADQIPNRRYVASKRAWQIRKEIEAG